MTPTYLTFYGQKLSICCYHRFPSKCQICYSNDFRYIIYLTLVTKCMGCIDRDIVIYFDMYII